MSGYQYRGGKCDHVGVVWNPPNTVVAEVPCPSCGAKPNGVCFQGPLRTKVEPHAARYLAHHDATCGKGEDYSQPLSETA